MRFPRLRRWAVVLTAVVTGSVLVNGPAHAASAGHVRLDQVGYGTFESKQAYLLLPTALLPAARTARYQVVGQVTSWPSSEPAIDFTATAVLAFTLT